MANRIWLETRDPQRFEKTASEAITPGHLVEVVASGGDAGQLKKHATAGGNAAPMFALEQDFLGKGIADAYADGDTVQYVTPAPGERVLAWIPASAAAIVDGDFLESAGGGNLRKHTAQAVDEGGTATVTVNAESILAVAAESKDNSAGGTAVRLRVRIV